MVSGSQSQGEREGRERREGLGGGSVHALERAKNHNTILNLAQRRFSEHAIFSISDAKKLSEADINKGKQSHKSPANQLISVVENITILQDDIIC